MGQDDSWPVVPDEVNSTLESLTATLGSHEDFAVLSHQACDQFATATPGVEQATITLLTDGRPESIASTSDVALDLDRDQYGRGDGRVWKPSAPVSWCTCPAARPRDGGRTSPGTPPPPGSAASSLDVVVRAYCRYWHVHDLTNVLRGALSRRAAIDHSATWPAGSSHTTRGRDRGGRYACARTLVTRIVGAQVSVWYRAASAACEAST
jgi:hypothetical protein